MTMNIATMRSAFTPPVRPEIKPASTSTVSTTTSSHANSDVTGGTSTSPLTRLLADKSNLFALAKKLHDIDTRIDGKPVSPEHVTHGLSVNLLLPHKDSACASINPAPQTLASVITDLGFELPKTIDEVSSLSKKLVDEALIHPLGNFGGGRSWPIPMSALDQGRIANFLQSADTQVQGLPLAANNTGALGYLLSGSSVTKGDLQDPVKALQVILDSPKAQALGRALESHLKGASSDVSLYDHLLTAIHVGLDPEPNTIPVRNKIAGFDMAKTEYWGQTASVIREGLSQHLVEKGRATADTAKVASHLLLANTAPEFLVKDVPNTLVYGSVMWVVFALSVAKLEDASPGRTQGMSYASVMVAAETLKSDTVSYQQARENILADWAVVNGLLAAGAPPTESQMEQVSKAFDSQLAALVSANNQIDTPIPTRKGIALEKLKAAFPDIAPGLFEAKSLFRVDKSPGRNGTYPGMYSMLDIVMEGPAMGENDHWFSSDGRIPAKLFCDLYEQGKLNVADTFVKDYDKAVASIQAGQEGITQYLISKLPLEARKDFEYGRLEFFKVNEYRETGVDPLSSEVHVDTTAHNQNPKVHLKAAGTTLHVQTTRNGVSNIYEINTKNGTINKVENMPPTFTPPYLNEARDPTDYSRIYRTVKFTPSDDSDAGERLAKRVPTQGLFNFSSARSKYISKVFSESLDLNKDEQLQSARGVTTYDRENAVFAAVQEFFLDLIPFRSAIKNFINGEYVEGAADLCMDAIGLVTLGAGKAAQATKAFASGVRTIRGVGKAARFIGLTALEAVNPLSGVRGLVKGVAGKAVQGVKLLMAKGTEVVNQLKGASGSYDLLKAASKQHGVVATGTYKVGDNSFEAGALLHEGKWYAYNPVTARPYGPPLPIFSAKSVAMGGEMQNFRILNNGLGMSEDTTKRGLRLTLDAHGAIPEGSSSALMAVNGGHISAYGLVDQLKTSGVNLSKYSEIRLTMCNSGTGAEKSFAATLAKLTRKPTEGFKGVMYTSSEVEDVAARMFKNGGAKQREFIEEHVNGQKKTIDKFKLTSVDSEHRGVYTHHPDYNPVRFDAEGRLLEAKPLRQSYTADKVDINGNEIADTKVYFDDYDDLT